MANTVLANLIVKIGADTRGVKKGLTSLRKQLGEITKSAFTTRNAFAVLAGATGFALASKKIFDLGAAVEETASKFNTVFGPAAEDTARFLDEFATKAGLSNRAAQDLIATTGAIVQGFGFTREASAELSKDVLRLAGDFASFNDVPTAETARAIQAALTGERESMKRLGVVILETDVQQQALADTGKKFAKNLTTQEKALATMALIAKRAGVQVGDLDRTQLSAANRAKALGGKLSDMADTLAVALNPALADMVGHLDDSVVAMATLTEDLKFFTDTVQVGLAEIVALARTAGNSIQIVFGVASSAVVELLVVVAQGFETLNRALNLIPGVNIEDFLSSADFIATSKKIEEAMARDAGQIADAWNNVFLKINEVNSRGLPELAAATDEVTDATDDASDSARSLLDNVTILDQGFIDLSNAAVRTALGFDQVATAEDDVTAATNRMNDALSKTRGILGALGGLGRLAGFAIPGVGAAGIGLSVFQGFKSAFGGGKADGGPVSSGKSFVVGERGPELFVPSQSGTIIPNGGGGDTFVQIVTQDGRALTDRINVTQQRDGNLRRIVRVPVAAMAF